MAVVRRFQVKVQGQQRWQEGDIEGQVVPLELQGERFLQVYSSGTKGRQEVGQNSQNLRLSREAFEQLVEIGLKHFGEI